MSSAFDQALEYKALRDAAEEYALKYGSPDSPAYLAALLRFRTQIRTLDDLERWRGSTRYGHEESLEDRLVRRLGVARAGLTHAKQGPAQRRETP